jgi:hypothetical protein
MKFRKKAKYTCMDIKETKKGSMFKKLKQNLYWMFFLNKKAIGFNLLTECKETVMPDY